MKSFGNGTKSLVSINSAIDFSKCEALNIQGDSVKEVFGYGGIIKSNKSDPEIIVLITFKEKVSLTGFMIESTDTETAPSIIEMYAGKNNLDFSDIGSIPSTEKFKCVVGKQVDLKIAKYRNIDHLAVYMSNPEAEMLKILNIQLYGISSENTDFSQVKNTNP